MLRDGDGSMYSVSIGDLIERAAYRLPHRRSGDAREGASPDLFQTIRIGVIVSDEQTVSIEGDSGTPRVLRGQCASCVMRTPDQGGIPLAPGRREQFIADAVAQDTYIVCHSTLNRNDVQPAICGGFWEKHKGDSASCRLISRFYDEADLMVPVPRVIKGVVDD